MHTLIKITGDDVPAGGLLIGADTETDPVLDQLIHDLRTAYPHAHHCVIQGMDVVTDVTSLEAPGRRGGE